MIDFVLDWLVANQMVLWLLAAVLCLLLEMGSPGLFFFLSFFFGALVASGATLVTASWLAQSFTFIVATLISFLLLHYWVKRRSKLFDTHTQTNVYALRDKRGRIVREIIPGKMGLVKIEGETWSARSLHEQTIKKGARVMVVRIKGAHLVVQEVDEKKQ